MIARILYAFGKPSTRPLPRVALYYLVLFGVSAVLALKVPGLVELATQEPTGESGFSGLDDSFEPIGTPADVSTVAVAGRLLLHLVAAVLLMLPLSWVYMGTRTRTGFDQSVVQTMIILPIAVAGVVSIVYDSIALAFSLAGIVAGVRFRNSLKDTADALYIFAAIGVGLATGVGALLIAALVSVFFNFVVLLLWRGDYGVCPKNGPQLEYTSGQTLGRLGIDLSPAAEADATKKKVKSKKKKKSHKKKHENASVVGETVEPAPPPVADAGTAVATAGEEEAEPPDPEDQRTH